MVTKESYNPSKPLLLLPAAGFGTRVGSPNAKEIFFGANGGPLIEASLHQARLRDWAVHVITRKEKTDLLNYLKEYQNKYFNPDQVDGFNISIQIIEPSREWPDTLLKSKDYKTALGYIRFKNMFSSFTKLENLENFILFLFLFLIIGIYLS